MILNDQDLVIREADEKDREQLAKLLQKGSFTHRHLSWLPPLAWLGNQPYLVLEATPGSARPSVPPEP